MWDGLLERFNLGYTRGPALLRRMGITGCDVDPARRGFIVVQIDGLSYGHMLNAMKRHRLPFLSKMVRTGKLKVHQYQSEIPTSTPAFQAGCFYGDNSNIPGFQFYDRKLRRNFRMGQTEFAYLVEKERANPGVLRDGSVFSCIYTGDAEAQLFIFSTMLAPRRWKFVFRVWDIVLLSVMNISIFFRMFFLGIIELGLALYDMVRWYVKRGQTKRELEFLGARLALTVIGRETITLGSIIDLFRGVPSIYLNYLGYDEHAHLRGPSSRVALWTLLGIDRSIARIYKAARSSEREYDLFILSDHGQVPTTPFETNTGMTLGQYLKDHLEGVNVATHDEKDERADQLDRLTDGMNRMAAPMPRPFRRPLRAYAKFLKRRVRKPDEEAPLPLPGDVLVTSTGPIAYVYWTQYDEPITAETIDGLHPDLLDDLAHNENIGFISMRTESGGVLIHSHEGQALLKDDKIEVSGKMPFDGSPFRAHVFRGVQRVTLMPRAGDICIWGNYARTGHITYSYERGAHSGCSEDEISAFIMAPPSVDYDFANIHRHDQFYELLSRYLPKQETAGEETTETA